MSIWKAKTLSFGGILTLIQSVLGNLPTYYNSILVSLEGVIEKLERIHRMFLWGGSDEKQAFIGFLGRK